MMSVTTERVERRLLPRSKTLTLETPSFSAYLIKNDQPVQILGSVLDVSEGGVGVRLYSASTIPRKGDSLHSIFFSCPPSNRVRKVIGLVRYIDFAVNEEGKHSIRMGIIAFMWKELFSNYVKFLFTIFFMN